jgi:hypothetical protein
MLDPTTTAIATGTAGNVIAYMLTGRVDALRSHVTRIFRHGSEQERSLALDMLEHDATALAHRTALEADVSKRWTDTLLDYLSAHPEALVDAKSFATTTLNVKQTHIGAQHNYGDGTFIGGDNYGDLHFGNHE